MATETDPQLAGVLDINRLRIKDLETELAQAKERITTLEAELADFQNLHPNIKPMMRGLEEMIYRYQHGRGSFGGTGIADELRGIVRGVK